MRLLPRAFSSWLEAGDEVAEDLIQRAGEALGSLAVGVIRQLGFQARTFDVILVGSLYDGGALLVDPLRQVVQAEAPGAHLVRLAAPPVVGGVLLAMEKMGERSASAREHLIETTCELFKDSI